MTTRDSSNPTQRELPVEGARPSVERHPVSPGTVDAKSSPDDAGASYASTGDCFATYMRDIRRVERLTHDEENRLAAERMDCDEQAADWLRALVLRTGLTKGPYACKIGESLRRDVRIAMCGTHADNEATTATYYEAVRRVRDRYLAEIRNATSELAPPTLAQRFGRLTPVQIDRAMANLRRMRRVARKCLRTLRTPESQASVRTSPAGMSLTSRRADRARTAIAAIEKEFALPIDELLPIASRLDELRARSQTIVDLMAQANLRLVVAIARRFSRDTNTLEDLVQEGNIALMKAGRYFDPSRGFAFSTLAATAIRRQIGQYLAKQHAALNLSDVMHQRDRRVRAGTDRLQQQLNTDSERREPTFAELADYLDTDQESVIEIVDATRTAVRLDDPVGDGTELRIDSIADSRAYDPRDIVDSHQTSASVSKAMSLLTKREREVIELRYFDQSDRADTLQSVGDTLSLSRERIRQIECRALQRLRCRR